MVSGIKLCINIMKIFQRSIALKWKLHKKCSSRHRKYSADGRQKSFAGVEWPDGPWRESIFQSVRPASCSPGPPARGQQADQVLTRRRAIREDLFCSGETPADGDFIKIGTRSTDDLFCRPHDPLQHFFVSWGTTSVPHRDWVFYGGAVECWQQLLL